MTTKLPADRRWLRSGTEFMATLHGSIAAARGSVRLEFYIVAPDATGTAVRDALADAAGRGVAVRVLVDALGTTALPSGFWRPVTGSGGEVKVFNPLTSRRLPVRDHRKLVDAIIAGVPAEQVPAAMERLAKAMKRDHDRLLIASPGVLAA